MLTDGEETPNYSRMNPWICMAYHEKKIFPKKNEMLINPWSSP